MRTCCLSVHASSVRAHKHIIHPFFFSFSLTGHNKQTSSFLFRSFLRRSRSSDGPNGGRGTVGAIEPPSLDGTKKKKHFAPTERKGRKEMDDVLTVITSSSQRISIPSFSLARMSAPEIPSFSPALRGPRTHFCTTLHPFYYTCTH